MRLEYVLIGGGDFAVEVASYLNDVHMVARDEWAVTDIVASTPPRLDAFEKVLGFVPDVHTDIRTVFNLTQKSCVVGIGNAAVRRKILEEIDESEAKLTSIIHPTAYISPTASLGAGSIICPFVFVGAFAKIGRNCAINVNAIVGHDVRLGDCSVLSPGADVNGHGETGEAAFLGAGSVISPKAALGSYGKLSAGSVLTRRTGEGMLMHGNPANGRQMFKRP